jgi:hypothetical protein
MPHSDIDDRLNYQRAYSVANRQRINERQREYRARNKERLDEYRREYFSNPETVKRVKEQSKKYWRQSWSKYKLSSLRNKAKRQGLDFDLEECDLVLPELCPVFGIPLAISDNKLSANSPSVDRIDNSKGYVKGNIVVVSHKANSMKRAATLAEMRQLADFYESLERTNNE